MEAVCPINASTTVETNTHTRFYVTLLTTSNTAPTTTTAAADEVDYVVRISKKLAGLDFQQKEILGFLFFTVAAKPLFKGCFVLLSLDKAVGTYS
jgi:hypothetical protein